MGLAMALLNLLVIAGLVAINMYMADAILKIQRDVLDIRKALLPRGSDEPADVAEKKPARKAGAGTAEARVAAKKPSPAVKAVPPPRKAAAAEPRKATAPAANESYGQDSDDGSASEDEDTI